MSPLPEHLQSQLESLRTQANLKSQEVLRVSAEQALLKRQFLEMVEEFKSQQHQIEIHEKASLALKDLIRTVSTQNLSQIEALVNSALRSVMPDKRVLFKISPVTRRDLTEYDLQIIRQDSQEAGTTESNGGGLLALIAFVLKVSLNILSGRAPLLVLDESLSFISEQYLLPTSELISHLAKEFNLTVLLVTHQPLFAEASPTQYLSQPTPNGTRLKLVKSPA